MAPERLMLKVQDLKQVMVRYLDRLRQHRDALNNLNVYPVPDGDTGTNMTLTVESVVAETEAAETMVDLAAAISNGSLMGAQGNSGIILSQILRGLADAFRDGDDVGAPELVEALDLASTAAYEAVGKPVEGTILTVLREAATAARKPSTAAGDSLAQFLRRVYDRAEQALHDTPELLPVLKEAGVVDAGGAGFLLLLAAFLEEVTGEDVVLPEAIFRAAAVQMVRDAEGTEERTIADLRYEVMFLLASETGDAGDRLRESWADLGDSIVVVGGDGTWNCHIHTDDIGPAVEAGIALGTPSRIKITDLLEQAADHALHEPARFEPLPDFASAPIGVVAVGAGAGVMSLFRDAGAQAMATGGQTMNPSVRDLLDVVESVDADDVIVLPNNKNVISCAEQLDTFSTKRVHVVATTSIPEGLGAILAYMPGGDPDEVAEAMRQAASEVRTGEMTRAVRDARTPAGEITQGDWLGLVSGEVKVIDGSAETTMRGLLGELGNGGAELVTLITGVGADDAVVDVVRRWVSTAGAELEVLDGGQPVYPYLVGVE